MMLLTASDREVFRLRREIDRHRGWMQEEAGDRRAVAFHQAKLAELQAELDKLEDYR